MECTSNQVVEDSGLMLKSMKKWQKNRHRYQGHISCIRSCRKTRKMTKKGFAAWTSTVSGSLMHWTLDEMRWHNDNEMFFYRGSRNGKFIRIYPDGQLEAGVYEGAAPPTMDARLTTYFSRKFDTQDAAHRRIVECGGDQFRQILPYDSRMPHPVFI